MLSLGELHQRCLFPEVRITAENKDKKARGSGTIVYSALIPGEENKYETYVLTNEHVVDCLITVKDEWSSLLGREVKKDIRGTAIVETFLYDTASRVIGSTSYSADIECYDKVEDLALLKIRAPIPFEHVATLYPEDNVDELLAGMEVITVGCGLGEKPVTTFGALSAFGMEIENREFILLSAPSIFGNSGGASFLRETGEFIGVPSRLPVILLGWSPDPITHMSYNIPVWRVYQFLRDQIYDFIFDESKTSKDCAEERQRRREEEELKLLRAGLRREEDKKPGLIQGWRV